MECLEFGGCCAQIVTDRGYGTISVPVLSHSERGSEAEHTFRLKVGKPDRPLSLRGSWSRSRKAVARRCGCLVEQGATLIRDGKRAGASQCRGSRQSCSFARPSFRTDESGYDLDGLRRCRGRHPESMMHGQRWGPCRKRGTRARSVSAYASSESVPRGLDALRKTGCGVRNWSGGRMDPTGGSCGAWTDSGGWRG